MPDPLRLHPDRFFDPDPAVRAAARDVYQATRGLPIVSPHGHVDPALLADDRPFPEPTELLVTPDHYVFRMLYSQGIDLDTLGIPRADGTRAETDPREVWRLFCAHYHLFLGTPSRAWLDYELAEVFGVDVVPSAETADRVYDHVAERLASPEYRPRALYDRFDIEVLATTDAATDDLRHHRRIADANASGEWSGRVVPTFRPDAVMRIARAGWQAEVAALAEAAGREVTDYGEFVDALADRRAFFQSLGATATDHAVVEPRTGWLSDADRDAVFARALDGRATPQDQAAFEAHFLMEMARQSASDGLVMQLHAGALRDHNGPLAEVFGPDKGADVPVATEWTRNLRPLLSAFGNDSRLRLILFTLDETTYARELAPLAGHYPAVVLGPAWWFHDSPEGIARYRRRTTETAGLSNTAGFNDDTRAFCSIPARHDLARRVDANWLGGLVVRHVLSSADARRLGTDLAVGLARAAYRLGSAG
ncbi:glucuronate isomerase [Rubrivirga sp.]|uniref:glucuronate isomerase n=1 Tax=Rubrivirga sp. TaxID=1885344 RepID=UPI003B52CA32